ncbi:hypothetical protein CBI36_02860 [Acetobacter oryzifermentans]|uniref:Helix-turn-helix domain-containing protein n=3 Tax=Acetobacteraceae TaxID=433 RepID=A0AAN1PIX6_9PROT|nr:hypothetical protein CBI36_02860 [Acetobacter oryzifermentans]AXN01078.1 helix-turn-helix domain-containing protein [Acetobacter pomorum]
MRQGILLSADKRPLRQYRYMELKDLIRAARKAKGLSQAALADLLHVNKSAVAQWELGSTRPTNESMAALKSVLSIGEQISPVGSAPYAGEIVEDPDELALLRFWRSLSIEKRRAVVELLHIGRPSDR